ncbi:MAG: phosphoribosyl-ATP diphosphatase [Anaerolineales bacterium]
MMNITNLYNLVQDRKVNPQESSYTSSLYAAGLSRIAQKVGEEASETIVAALTEEKQRLIEEIADLTYHVLVLMVARDITPQDILAELDRRRR